MIQVPENEDRGRALFKMHPSAITSMVSTREQEYFLSPAAKGLKNNCTLMDQYIDNENPSTVNLIADIAPPTIRRSYNEFQAIFHKFLETDPLFGSVKRESIPEEVRRLSQMAVNDNLAKTYYRERCLQWTIDDIVRYGSAATYTFATNDYNANSLMTIKTEDYGDYQQVREIGENVALSVPIHPLNVIVDPRANFQTAPDYIGFLGDISLSKIRMLEDNDAYIGENVKKVFKEGKLGFQDQFWYAGEGYDKVSDYSKGHSNILYMWMRLPFDGNEDDPTWYAVEKIGPYIIRIEEMNLDENVIPIALKRVFPRKYQWYGNSPLVEKIAIQNLQYWVMNTMVESTARLMDRLVLYREGTLDVEAINSRHQTGGLVPYKGTEQDLSKLMYGVSLPSVGTREADWLLQESRREDQETSMLPNFNPMSKGGPTNSTLGGAQMMASIGEMRASFTVGQMAVGLKDVAKHHLVILRNIMDEKATMSNGEEVTKDNLLGKVQFYVKLSNVYNYIKDGIDAENRLTNLLNRRATGTPQFKAVKVGQMVKDSLRNSLKRENIADYIDEELLDNLDKQDAMSVMPQPPAPSPMPGMGPQVLGMPPGAPQIPPAPGVMPNVQ